MHALIWDSLTYAFLLCLILALVIYILTFFRVNGTCLTIPQRSLLVLLAPLIFGPSATLNIVTCSMHLVQLEENVFYNPFVQRWLATKQQFVYVIPHHHPHHHLPQWNILSPDEMNVPKAVVPCQHTTVSDSDESTTRMMKKMQFYYPNVLVGIPREEISPLPGSASHDPISNRSPTSPNSSSFAIVGEDIHSVISFEHIYPVIEEDRYKNPVIELTHVRAPLLSSIYFDATKYHPSEIIRVMRNMVRGPCTYHTNDDDNDDDNFDDDNE